MPASSRAAPSIRLIDLASFSKVPGPSQEDHTLSRTLPRGQTLKGYLRAPGWRYTDWLEKQGNTNTPAVVDSSNRETPGYGGGQPVAELTWGTLVLIHCIVWHIGALSTLGRGPIEQVQQYCRGTVDFQRPKRDCVWSSAPPSSNIYL